MPTIRGSATGSVGAYGTGRTIAKPAGLTVDDVVVLAVRCDVAPNPEFVCTGFTTLGWAVDTANNITNVTILVGTGILGGGDLTITSPVLASGVFVATVCTAWQDADLPALVGLGFAGQPTASTVAVPSVTTTADGAVIIVAGGQTFGGLNAPVGFTTGLVTDGCAQHYTTQTLAGATGDVSTPTTNAFSSVAAWLVAVQPPLGPPPLGDVVRTGAGVVRGPNSGLMRPSGAPPPSGLFDVWNGRIRSPDGLTFRPVGVNTAIKITEYAYVFEHPANLGTISSYEADPITFPSHVTETQTWNLDLLRCNLIIINNDPTGPNPNDPALMAELIEHGVNELLAAGFVVMLTSMDFTGSPNVPLSGGTADLGVRAFYAACITKWGTNPRFWINPYNEPYADGAPALANWVELHTNMITFLRGAGYTGPIVCDLPRFGQGIDNLAAGDLDTFATHDPGIVFGWHAYGIADPDVTNTFTTHENEATAAKARGHTVLIGECGVANPPSSGDGPWQFNEVGFGWAMDRARALNMGVTWWHGFHDQYQLRTDGLPFWNTTDGTELTTFGTTFWGFAHP